MKAYLVLTFALYATLLSAQHSIFTPDEQEDIYNYFVEERPFYLIPQETFVMDNYLEFVGEETIDHTKKQNSIQKVKIVYSDSGFVFYNIGNPYSASYGLMKDVDIYYDYVHNSDDLEQHISFNWHYQNSYDDRTGIAAVKIRRQFNPETEDVSVDIWIEVPADPQSHRDEDREGSTLFIHGEIQKKVDQNNHRLFRL